MNLVAWGSLVVLILGRWSCRPLSEFAQRSRLAQYWILGPILALPFAIWTMDLALWILCFLIVGLVGWKFLPPKWGYLLLPLGLVWENFGFDHRVSMLNLSLGLSGLWLSKANLDMQNANPFRLFWGSVWSPTESSRYTADNSSINLKAKRWSWLESAWMLSLGLFEISLATWIGSPVSVSSETLESTTSADAIYMLLSITLWFFLGLDGSYRVVRALASVVGIRVASNFDRPWLALDVADHWRRWHVPVMHWLNFFVYTPARVKLRRWPYAHVLLTFGIFIIVGQLIRTGWGSLLWGVCNSILVLVTPPLFRRLRGSLESFGKFGVRLGLILAGGLTAFVELLMKPLVALDYEVFQSMILRILAVRVEGLGNSSLWDDFFFVLFAGIVVFRVGQWAELRFDSGKSRNELRWIDLLLAATIPVLVAASSLLVRGSAIPYIGGE